MKGYKELNWKTAKGMMSDPNFLRSLMEIDFDSISQSQVKNIKGEWGGWGVTIALEMELAFQFPLVLQGQRRPLAHCSWLSRGLALPTGKQELMGTQFCLGPLCGLAFSLCAS